MAYVETSEDLLDYGLIRCRIQYAAFLHDEYRKRPGITFTKSVQLAAAKAGIHPAALRQHLPSHNRFKRNMRNLKIIDMRASGFSVNLIAKTLHIHRATVSRVLEAHQTRVNAANRYRTKKIRGRLKYGDPRLDENIMYC